MEQNIVILFHDMMNNVPSPLTGKLWDLQRENVKKSFDAVEIVDNHQKRYLFFIDSSLLLGDR